MSSVLTLPVSAGEEFSHGHHSHSPSKSNTRHGRSSARLAPPFGLPRIPSESVGQRTDDHNQFESHSNQPATQFAKISRTPNLDPNAALVAKKRSFEVATMSTTCHGGHKHRHVSKPTELLLNTTENYSLLHGILADHDSRRIFYFMILNLAFMVVQSTYGYLTGSLGLISDSIHMFFDCVALLVGVCAAVMSKWPPSAKFPYGYGKIDTLAGLGNGIFLMLISVEIVYEAVERLFTGADVSRTTELLLVSTAGLAVNLVGIFAFHGHHHHGHDHSHSHDHDHHHSHDHSHQHSHSLHSRKGSDASFVTAVTDSPKKQTRTAHAHGHHHHGHGSENMEGIYLHIMADALGSVSVVISTLLVKFTDWSGWDPIASVIIAVLIFISTIPLVTSTTKILLLSLNSDIEYNLRDILSGVNDIKGVIGYAVPKFWLEDIKKESGHDDHHHHHHDEHDSHHSHSREHSHHRHDSKDSDAAICDGDDDGPAVLGVIHIIGSQSADLADVRTRVSNYFTTKKMDVVVQVEREGEGRCFCGGGLKSN